MARMYSRKKGRSGSKRPKVREAKWISHKPAEIKDIIVKLSNEGKSSAEIGSILRDHYGIPSVRMVSEKRISQIMKENDVSGDLPEDMLNLLKNAVRLRKHLDDHRHDRYSKRGLELTESKIRRLAKYYKSRDILPGEWNYDPEKAKLLVK